MEKIDSLKSKFIKNNNKYDMFFTRYFYYLYGLAVSRFKWINLPDEIDPVFMESQLFYRGNLVFFRDDVTGLFAVMNGFTSGNMDIYGFGNMRFAYSNQYQIELDKTNSVLMHDNRAYYPSADIIAMHADALANIRISRDVNLVANRTPVIVSSTSDQRLSSSNIMKQIIDCIPFIHLKNGAYSQDNFKALKTDAPVLFPELNSAMDWEIADACKYLGINAFYSGKKERLVSGETNGNKGELEMARKNALEPRQRSCEQINKMFGLDMWVEFNSDIPILDSLSLENVSSETLESEV